MRILLALAAVLCAAPTLPAQEAVRLDPGAGVRVAAAAPDARLWAGPRGSPADTAARLGAGTPALAAPVGIAAGAERRRGRKPSVVGGVVGFVVGGAVGGALGCLANRDDYGVFCGGQSDTRVFVGAALGGAAGAALGAWLFGRER